MRAGQRHTGAGQRRNLRRLFLTRLYGLIYSQIPATGLMKNNRGFTLIELSVVACIFLLMAAALMPFVHIANGRAQRVRCASNLMRLSLGLHRYALDHAEAFPPDLSSLYPDYVKDRRVFNCPSVKAVGTPEKPGNVRIAGLFRSPDSFDRRAIEYPSILDIIRIKRT